MLLAGCFQFPVSPHYRTGESCLVVNSLDYFFPYKICLGLFWVFLFVSWFVDFLGCFFVLVVLVFLLGWWLFVFVLPFFLFGWGFLVVGLLGFLRLVLLDLG